VALRHEGVDAPAAVELDGAEVTVTLDGLAPGKYTLVAGALDAADAAADEVLVPFWIEAEPFDWRDALIYMVMTDRFRNGDPSNDPPPYEGAEAAADFYGGDLAGVTAAIEDGTFDALGVRALWLSPFVENATTVELENGHGVTAYHGYWPIKARAVDPRLGTEADLDLLVSAAHRHGIRVLMDYVINHVHQDHEYVATHPDWFRVGCECGKPGCDWTEHRLDCSFHPYMPDVDWQNRAASEQMIADALWWVERFDLDGLRVDAVKHVEDLAVTNLSTRVHEAFEQGGTEYFLLGETAMGWNGDDLNANLPEYATIARYIGAFALSGQFDFVLYHATAYRVWADEARGMLHLDYWTRASLDQYPADAVMTPFVGSHDSERLVSLAQYGSGSATVHHKWVSDGLPVEPGADLPYERATLALTWLMTVPGAPLLYYGDEYGEYGGADPDNRHMWAAPAERTAREAAMYTKVARAAALRQELAALRRGDYQPLTVTEDVLSFLRVSPGDAVAVVINRGAAQTVSIDIPTGAISDGTLIDRLDPAGRTVQLVGGHLAIPMAARSAAVLVRQ
jgi:glycosidase